MLKHLLDTLVCFSLKENQNLDKHSMSEGAKLCQIREALIDFVLLLREKVASIRILVGLPEASVQIDLEKVC